MLYAPPTDLVAIVEGLVAQLGVSELIRQATRIWPAI